MGRFMVVVSLVGESRDGDLPRPKQKISYALLIDTELQSFCSGPDVVLPVAARFP